MTKEVPAYALLVGNPAKQIGWMSQRGHKLDFDTEGLAKDPEDGSSYRLTEGIVRKLS